MLENTDTKDSPWYIVPADIKKHARINCISHLLSLFDYEDFTEKQKDLPVVPKSKYDNVPYKIDKIVPDEASKLI